MKKFFAPINNLILNIPYKLCGNLLLAIFALITIFHILVLVEIIPYAYVWAGKLKSKEEMYSFEFVSLGINILMSIVVLSKLNILKIIKNRLLLKILLISMSVLFLLNTIGNTYSVSGLELYIATPMTFILAILIYRLSLEE